MKLGDKELAHLKKTLSTEDILEIVNLKTKMNKRARRTDSTKPINEGESLIERQAFGQPTWVEGFKKFCLEYLDDKERHQIEIIFSKLSDDVVNQRFLQTVYSSFSEMIDKIDQEMIDSAN